MALGMVEVFILISTQPFHHDINIAVIKCLSCFPAVDKSAFFFWKDGDPISKNASTPL
jgi:hypothetical protein